MPVDEAEEIAQDLERQCSDRMLGYGACGSRDCDLCNAAKRVRARKHAPEIKNLERERGEIDRQIRKLKGED